MSAGFFQKFDSCDISLPRLQVVKRREKLSYLVCEAGWIVGSVGVVGKATDTVWGFRLDRVANDLIATTFCSSVMTWSVFGHGR